MKKLILFTVLNIILSVSLHASTIMPGAAISSQEDIYTPGMNVIYARSDKSSWKNIGLDFELFMIFDSATGIYTPVSLNFKFNPRKSQTIDKKLISILKTILLLNKNEKEKLSDKLDSGIDIKLENTFWKQDSHSSWKSADAFSDTFVFHVKDQPFLSKITLDLAENQLYFDLNIDDKNDIKIQSFVRVNRTTESFVEWGKVSLNKQIAANFWTPKSQSRLTIHYTQFMDDIILNSIELNDIRNTQLGTQQVKFKINRNELDSVKYHIDYRIYLYTTIIKFSFDGVAYEFHLKQNKTANSHVEIEQIVYENKKPKVYKSHYLQTISNSSLMENIPASSPESRYMDYMNPGSAQISGFFNVYAFHKKFLPSSIAHKLTSTVVTSDQQVPMWSEIVKELRYWYYVQSILRPEERIAFNKFTDAIASYSQSGLYTFIHSNMADLIEMKSMLKNTDEQTFQLIDQVIYKLRSLTVPEQLVFLANTKEQEVNNCAQKFLTRKQD